MHGKLHTIASRNIHLKYSIGPSITDLEKSEESLNYEPALSLPCCHVVQLSLSLSFSEKAILPFRLSTVMPSQGQRKQKNGTAPSLHGVIAIPPPSDAPTYVSLPPFFKKGTLS